MRTPIVYVVDDDPSVRQGIDSLLRSVGYDVFCFDRGDAFLSFPRPDCASCMLLDVRMPGLSGLELQAVLRSQRDAIPVIFLTGHGDVPLSVRAMKSGALDFLLKPFNEQDLIDVVRLGVDEDRSRRIRSAGAAAFEKIFGTLSKREAEVIAFVVGGKANKDIAAELGLAEITIKVNRANAMRKLQCRTVAELVVRVKGLPA